MYVWVYLFSSFVLAFAICFFIVFSQFAMYAFVAFVIVIVVCVYFCKYVFMCV